MSADRRRGQRSRLAWLAAGALGLGAAACGGGDPPRSTEALLELWNDVGSATTPGAPRPDLVLLSWLDDTGFVFRDRPIEIPAGTSSFLGNVVIWIDDADAGPRRFYGRGQVAGSTVSEGGGRDTVLAGERGHPLYLRLSPLPPPPTVDPYDADRDGVPDAADDCPTVANPEQTPGGC